MFVHVDNARRAGSRDIRVLSKANTKSFRGKKTTGNGIGCYLRWCLFVIGRNGKEVLWMKGKISVRKTSGP